MDKKYTFLSDYISKREKVKVKCNDCGNIYEILPENVYKGRCKFCAAINRATLQKRSVEDISKEIEVNFPNYILVSKEYRNNKEPIKFQCKKCNSEFETSLTNLKGGTHCPKCFSQSSKKEKDISLFIRSLGVDVKKMSMKLNNRKNEIDIFSNSKKIGIEFNGLYWHSDKFKKNNAMREKMTWARTNGIRLINIFEDEWDLKREIVKDKLCNIFGTTTKKIYARKCIVRTITATEKNKFLEDNHIQGKDISCKNCGLFYNNQLVAVMTFSKLRRNLGFKNSPDGYYELSRFAGLIGHNIVGGFSKLLKFAIELWKIRKIITYADLRWSSLENNIYIRNGFVLDHISAPSYSYLDKNSKKRISRFMFRKNNLKKLFPRIYSDKKSELEIMHEAGYHRIYDCGNVVYTLEI